MKKERITHKDRVLQYLRENGSITSWEAIKEFGNTRLSATIFLLREDGHFIETKFQSAKNRYGDEVSFARYILHNDEEEI